MNRLWCLLLCGGVAVSSEEAEVNLGPLPTVDAVLKRVVARSGREAENDRAFAAQYSFKKSKVTEYRNGEGELKKRQAKTKVHTPAGGSEPVSNLQGGSIGQVSGKDFDKKNVLANPDLLARFDFKLVRREQIKGRDTLVLDFQPKAEAVPERNLTEKFLNKAAGRVWVDEGEAVVVKADLYLSERVDVLIGVAGAVWKFTFGFDRERTTEGLWYVRDTRWHLEGREVVLNRIIDFHETRSEVRKVVSSGKLTVGALETTLMSPE